MVTFCCAIVGVAGSVFPVDIDESKSVGHLKDAIKAEKPDTITCGAYQLQLFLAKKGDTWLKDDDPVAVQLDKGEIKDVRKVTTEEQLKATWTIEDVLIANNMTKRRAPKSRQIHVLVVVPERPAKEATAAPTNDRLLPGGGKTRGEKVVKLLEAFARWLPVLSYFYYLISLVFFTIVLCYGENPGDQEKCMMDGVPRFVCTMGLVGVYSPAVDQLFKALQEVVSRIKKASSNH